MGYVPGNTIHKAQIWKHYTRGAVAAVLNFFILANIGRRGTKSKIKGAHIRVMERWQGWYNPDIVFAQSVQIDEAIAGGYI